MAQVMTLGVWAHLIRILSGAPKLGKIEIDARKEIGNPQPTTFALSRSSGSGYASTNFVGWSMRAYAAGKGGQFID